MKHSYLSNSPENTMDFAKNYARTLSTPKIILLSGDLGAGKTTFAKGFAEGLGIKETITSPTFTLLNEYNGTLPLYHFDMYRLCSPEEAYGLGFENYFNHKKLPGIILVEWAENVKGLINKPYIKISITKENENSRNIMIEDIK